MYENAHRVRRLLAVLFCLACAARSYALEPWNEPVEDSSDYLDVLYDRARDALAKKEWDRAIKLLRQGIQHKDQGASSGNKWTSKTPKTQYPYYPYLDLATAFLAKDDCTRALACLERERKSKKILGSERADEFQRFDGNARPRCESRELLALADRVLALPSEPDWAQAAGVLDPIRVAKEELTRSPDARIAELSLALRGKILDFGRQQVRARKELVQDLATRYPEAFREGRAVPEACRESAGEDLAAASAGYEAVLACSRAELEGMRRAGSWICGNLADELQSLKRSIDTYREIRSSTGASSGEDPTRIEKDLEDLPPECQRAWSGSRAEITTAWNKVKSLSGGYHAAEARVTSGIEANRAGLRKGMEDARSALPSLSAECARELGVQDSLLGRLSKLRDELNPERVPAKGALDREQIQSVVRSMEDVTTQTSALKGSAQEGVRQVSAEALELRCEFDARLGKIRSALDRYASRPQSSELKGLCDEVLAGKSELVQCAARYQPAMAEQMRSYPWLLGTADAWYKAQRDTALLQGVDLTCLEKHQPDARRCGPSAGGSALDWVKRCRDPKKSIDGCLAAYRSQRDRWNRKVLLEAGSLCQVAEQASATLETAVEGLRTECGRLREGLESLRSWFQVPSDAAAARKLDLKQAMEKAGVPPSLVPEEEWRRLERLVGAESDASYVEVWTDLRDAAAEPLLRGGGRLLEKYPFGDQLAPLSSLSAALEALAEGDVDGAILELRIAHGRDQFAKRGRDRALGHATLSYLLFTKASLYEPASRAATLLLADAGEEATEAHRADASLRLPEAIFESPTFREFFESRRR